ncbi:MAG: ATP-independent RNA helicase DbpA [Limisphaerales bacterium]|jgi:ATP-independent RNA helicase DbpA
MTQPFSELEISELQLKNLEQLGYSEMTPIQAASLPLVLKGKDVIAQAKTGSGKTAAFGIGLVEGLRAADLSVQALVLCPTRELADQVAKEVRRLARAKPNVKIVLLCGGKPFGPQKKSLANGAHIVIGTPGRTLDHLTRGTLKLRNLSTLVLDEGDRMLDMGFSEDLEQIIKQTPKSRQTLLFSATYPDEIRAMSASIQRKAEEISVDTEHETEVIDQVFYEVERHQRNNTLLALFEHHKPSSTLVFCHTKIQCDEVAQLLNDNRIHALAIHGDFDQRTRDKVLAQFSNQSCPVLVATDVAARGIDIANLRLVINYELPRDPEIYVHRIGRTGRAGNTGSAASIFTNSEQRRIKEIEAYQKEPCVCDVLESLDREPNYKLFAPMVTIEFNSGRKNKLRPGDILGALTGDAGLAGDDVGKIDIFDMASFVAVKSSRQKQVLEHFESGKIKGRAVKARRLK